ncbi:MAG: cob(I)yrinic acid a,c-diamide adenosyltransferase [Flavobacteriales bacterium]|nr:cob(I)yrinic acid a,c-diamide adenosyltransferase [Flavobacteriales bacterium]
MKIYTKKGDTGMTSLFGGSRLPKSHDRIEAYGTVDELNSMMGMLRDQDVATDQKAILLEIQDRLFTIGSHMATDLSKKNLHLPGVNLVDVEVLEKEIDNMEAELEPMKSFVLPGGHVSVSWCHLARCVCRRAERATVAITEEFSHKEVILAYLNRLSDYLFVLSRDWTRKLQVDEIPWKPRMQQD